MSCYPAEPALGHGATVFRPAVTRRGELASLRRPYVGGLARGTATLPRVKSRVVFALTEFGLSGIERRGVYAGDTGAQRRRNTATVAR